MLKLSFDPRTRQTLLDMYAMQEAEGDRLPPYLDAIRASDTIEVDKGGAKQLWFELSIMCDRLSLVPDAKPGTSEWFFGRLHDSEEAGALLTGPLAPHAPGIDPFVLARGRSGSGVYGDPKSE